MRYVSTYILVLGGDSKIKRLRLVLFKIFRNIWSWVLNLPKHRPAVAKIPTVGRSLSFRQSDYPFFLPFSAFPEKEIYFSIFPFSCAYSYARLFQPLPLFSAD